MFLCELIHASFASFLNISFFNTLPFWANGSFVGLI